MYATEDYFKKLEEIGIVKGALIGTGVGVVAGIADKMKINKKIRALRDKLADTDDTSTKDNIRKQIEALKEKKASLIKKSTLRGAKYGAAIGGVAGLRQRRKIKLIDI